MRHLGLSAALLSLAAGLVSVLACNQPAVARREPATPQKPVPSATELLERLIISVVQDERTLAPYETNEETIAARLRELPGAVRVTGWRASRLEDQNYLVTFNWTRDGIEEGFPFDVVTYPSGFVVRVVVGDPVLEKKHGWVPIRPQLKPLNPTEALLADYTGRPHHTGMGKPSGAAR